MTQPLADREPNYRRKLREMMRRGLLPTSVGLHEVLILHDHDCASLAGGVCNCDPDIESLVSPPDARHH
jgi:hypothetical protein